jgi:hypothetical protein
MNSLWDIRIFLGLVPKESPCTSKYSGKWNIYTFKKTQEIRAWNLQT